MTKTKDTDYARKASVAALEGYEDRMWGNQGHGTAHQAAEANGYTDAKMQAAYMRGWNRADMHTSLRPAFYDAVARVLKMATGCAALGHGEDHTATQAVVDVCLRYADAVSDDGGAASTGAPDQSAGVASKALGSVTSLLMRAEAEMAGVEYSGNQRM